VLLDDLDDPPGGRSVRLLFVGTVGRGPGERYATAATRVVFILHRARSFLARRKRDAGAAFGDVPAHGVLEETVGDLSDTRREIALCPEMLREKDAVAKVGPRRCGVAEDACRLWPLAAEQRCARGVAERIVAIGAIEANAWAGKPVDVGRPDNRVAVA